MEVTFTWIVTVPLAGMVTLPEKLDAPMVKLLVLAPPATVLVMLAKLVVRLDGRVSRKPVVRVDGPALLNMRVKLVVPPAAMVVLPTTLVAEPSTTVWTLSAVVDVLLLAVGSGLVLVTLTLLVKDPVGKLLSLTVSVIEPEKPLAIVALVAVRLVVLVCRLIPLVVVALTRVKSAGSTSVSVTFWAADGPALPIAIT